MTPTQQRIQQLATASVHPVFTELIGQVSEQELSSFIQTELSHIDALETFLPHGNIQSQAVAPQHILHIVSSNTPHAAIQSLFRGILLGSNNTIKLPSTGLPELCDWLKSLPEELKQLVTLVDDLNDFDWNSADAVIAIGSDSTIHSIQKRILPHQTFIPHGHKISIGVVSETTTEAAALAARDISLYDQRGCLSLHAIYVDESGGTSARQFAQKLALAMEEFATHTPPHQQALSEAGAVYNLRETTRYLAANSDTTALFESEDSLHWTVVYQSDPTLHLSCLGRCAFVKPLPTPLDTTTLGPQSLHLSTIALYPFNSDLAKNFTQLPAHRVCPLGNSQSPSLFWHHDGFAPLASLVKWKDIG